MASTRADAKPKPRAPKGSPWERFPLRVLPVSYIVEQCYCEHRVHLWLRKPGSRISIPRQLEGKPGPALRQQRLAEAGTAFHHQAAATSGTEPTLIEYRELRALVRRSAYVQMLEVPLLASYMQFPIAGIPDAVCFETGHARCILDYKLTDSNQLQMSHRVQLLLYGWLLQEAKFKLKDALLVCVLVPRVYQDTLSALDQVEHRQLATTLHLEARRIVEESPERRNWYLGRFSPATGLTVRLRIFRYDRLATKRELAFFAPYWSGDRPAIPSTRSRKCSVCLYNYAELCKEAVTPYAGNYSEI
jgi:hypothetical protein